jgi:hypothetical protein
MLWTKFVIPLAFATVGVGAAAAAVVLPGASASTGGSQAWIDAPLGLTAYAPGTLTVTAHATADEAISGLELVVDGDEVASDTSLVQVEKLVYGTFSWEAEVGEHTLVVKQLGGTGAASAPRVVFVQEGAPEAPTPTIPGETSTTTTPETSTTTTTTTPDETTTTVQDATTTTAPVGTTVPPEVPDTVPSTQPPTTAAPKPKPTFGAVSLTSPYENRVYLGNCTYQVDLRAVVRNADYVQVTVEGTGFVGMMRRSGDTFTLVIGSGPSVWGSGDSGVRRVILDAGGGGTNVQRVAGTLDIRTSCPKD